MAMCGAWQPGGHPEAMLWKIPGFASPPLDGFAVFADRTPTTHLAVVNCAQRRRAARGIQ
jgi:hypothetical protein